MRKSKFTAITQLHVKHNADLIEYVETSRGIYAQAVRETFYSIKNDRQFNKSKYNTYLQNKYGITGRTANSILSGAQGRYNAIKELKKYERLQLDRKIKHLENTVIPKLVEERDRNSARLREGLYVSINKQRNLRRKIVAKKAKLNRLKQHLSNLIWQIDTGNLKLCFGTKYLLKRNYAKFVEQRDSQMSFVGSKMETSGNQNLQLTYDSKTNQFSIKMRKDFGGYKSAKGDDRYVFGRVYFRHHKDKIVSILRNRNSPLSYKIIKRNNRFYLYCTFEIQVEEDDFITRSNRGTIGLDFNEGFVTLSETNRYGHLVQTQLLPYRFKAGNKTKTDLQNIANHVVSLAVMIGKDVCIEDLDFKRTKSKTETKDDRKYNKMIHSFAYRQFVDTIESIAYRKLVTVKRVNPAWTSWLAKQIYCPIMKLNVHVGASYVIARRGQGYKDAI